MQPSPVCASAKTLTVTKMTFANAPVLHFLSKQMLTCFIVCLLSSWSTTSWTRMCSSSTLTWPCRASLHKKAMIWRWGELSTHAHTLHSSRKALVIFTRALPMRPHPTPRKLGFSLCKSSPEYQHGDCSHGAGWKTKIRDMVINKHLRKSSLILTARRMLFTDRC